MSTIRALVTPKLLAWARESAHLRLDEASKKIGVPDDELRAWESGDQRPPLGKARKAAHIYGRPFAVFYLEEIPKDFALVRDFRRVSDDVAGGAYTYALTILLREMRARQEWVREILKDFATPRLTFVGSVTLETDVHQVSEAIRKKLGLSLEEQLSWGALNTALNAWIERVEGLRMFVSQTSERGKVLVRDARGFALVDALAPFIFVNSKDSLGGRIFTLAHELAHVWLGESGVSGEDLRGAPHSQEERIERFCNRVAALVVFPDDAYKRSFSAVTRESEAIDLIDRVARWVSVSRDVVARRLLDDSLLARSTYKRLHSGYLRDWQTKQRQASGGGNYYVIHARALSKSFVRLVADAYSRGGITGAEAAALVNAKLDNMNRLVGAACAGTSIDDL